MVYVWMILRAIVIAYALICLALFVFQRKLIYAPQPADFPHWPTITLQTDAGDVHAVTQARTGPDAVLYFGGNAEDVSTGLAMLARVRPNDALYLLHYRGYGPSAGSPSEAALFADALALFDVVNKSHDNIRVIGRSLGSGVAVYLASQRPVKSICLVTPYSSLADVAAEALPYFPVRLLLTDRFDSVRYAPGVSAPVLVLAAAHDEVIPRWSTERLQASFPQGRITSKTVLAADHNTISHFDDYWEALRAWQ